MTLGALVGAGRSVSVVSGRDELGAPAQPSTATSTRIESGALQGILLVRMVGIPPTQPSPQRDEGVWLRLLYGCLRRSDLAASRRHSPKSRRTQRDTRLVGTQLLAQYNDCRGPFAW